MTGRTNPSSRAEPSRARLRAWLEQVASSAIDWLDQIDAQDEDSEDDELGDDMAVRRD